MDSDALTYLRLHLEAVWGITLPADFKTSSEFELPPESKRPPWKLLQAATPVGCLQIWRPDIPLSERAILQLRLQESLYIPAKTPALEGISREVALYLAASPAIEDANVRDLTRLLTVEDRPLLEAFDPGWTADYLRAESRPLVGVVIGQRLLSVAKSARRTLEACELGIDTLLEARRKGYALAATVAWTREVQREGLVPLYSALVENTASQMLAAQAGYRGFALTANIR